MVYYGEGFTHSDIYNMPIYLRNFYYQKLIDTKKEEKKRVEKANKQSTSKINKPYNPRR